MARVVDYKTQGIVRGQLFLMLEGMNYFRNCGSVKVSEESTSETVDIRTNETANRDILASIEMDRQGTLKITFQSLIPLVYAIAQKAPAGELFKQTAIANGSQTFEDVTDGDIARIVKDGKRVYSLTAFSCEPAGAASCDMATGRVEFLADAAEVTVTYTAAAVTESAKRHAYRLLQAGEVRGVAEIRQHNKLGDEIDAHWPRVSLKMTGSLDRITDSNDPVGVEVEARIEFDPSAPVGVERGDAVTL